MAVFRIIIIFLVVAFAGMMWFKPDTMISAIDPVADQTKEWFDSAFRLNSDPNDLPLSETSVASNEEGIETGIQRGILPAPAIPEEVMIDAPELAGSLREAGFVTNHSSRPGLPNVRSVTPEDAEIFRPAVMAVVGGTEENIRNVPWLVGLNIHTEAVYEGELVVFTEICGGGVFDSRWIITAAHCVDGDYNEIEIIAGSSRLDSESAIRRVSQRVFIHAGYERNVLREDIAIIELDEPLPGEIPMAPWPTREQALKIPEVTKVTGRGFGLTELGWASDTLKRVDLDVQDSTLRVLRVADGEGRVQGLCQGDSGTPITGTVDEETFIVGMVSYTEAVPGARNCSTPGFVAGLVSLEGYMDDIRSVVNLCSIEREKCDA